MRSDSRYKNKKKPRNSRSFRVLELLSCCGARCSPCRRCGCVAHRPFGVPDIFLAVKGCVSYRPRHTLRPRCICPRQRSGSWPLPLAQLPLSATGGGRLAPQIFTGFASSKGCSNKKSAIPVGMTDFLELLARFELATSSLPRMRSTG